MPAPPLRTKLYVPPVRPQFVPRRHLVERLNAGPDWKLALVCAPAGYGKSTLLSQWIAEGTPFTQVAWLSLDQGDNDLKCFLADLQASLEGIALEISAPLQAQAAEGLEGLLNPLINQISRVDGRFVLMLDDYHRIQNQAIHQALGYLLDHLPLKMQLVLATRTDPPLRLAQRRARGELCEIRAEDLRFSTQDAVRFLNQSMELALSPADVAKLTEKTEGWIAGLQLAAISLRSQPDKHAFVTAFAGDDRHIADYLLDEVLDNQVTQVQRFLMQSSILDQFCAPLCDAVTGGKKSQEILETLERDNLFLVPLDNQRNWYRYHHLFADLLRVRLKRAAGDSLPELYRRASTWYEGQQLVSEAVRMALLGDDTEKVARLMEGHLLAVVSTSELSVMQRLLASLPKEVMSENPWLALARAWGMAYLWQLESVEPLMETVLSVLQDYDQATRRRLEGRVLVLRSYVAGCKREYAKSIQIAQNALELVPDDDLAMRSFAILIIGNAHLYEGKLARATECLTHALSLSNEAGDMVLSVIILARLADQFRITGRLNRAYKTGMQALEMVEGYQNQIGSQSFIAGYLKLRLSGVYYERNELEMALQAAQVGLDLAKQWGAYDSMSLGYYSLAKIHRALGDNNRAGKYLLEFKESTPSEERLQYRIASAIETEINLDSGDLQKANDWMESCGFKLDDRVQFRDFQFYDVLAQVLIAGDQVSEAQALLERLLRIAEKAGAVEYEIQTLGRLALLLEKGGEREGAMAMLARSLTLAAPEGYRRCLLDQGEAMAQLLYKAALEGHETEFCHQLLEQFSSAAEFEKRSQGGLVEALSDREIEVLTLIAEGLTNQEIAQALFVSLYTIKSHARNIYGKLGVKNRTEAVTRARLFGLLP